MSDLLWQWLTGVLATRLPWHPATHSGRMPGRHTRYPLTWRDPWQGWQLLSWAVVTLLAPPFWTIGILLLINSHSDQPLFWPSVLAIVALTNAVTIVAVNQRHHRQPFTGHGMVFLHYLKVSVLTGGGLFLLLAWATGILTDLIATTGADNLGSAMLWTGAIGAGFGLAAFLPASVIHARFAFEDPYA
ncbi:MAG TPA: hypothetical protein VGG24_20070 [Paraburkholderia sp.]|jgi:hypothetical protein